MSLIKFSESTDKIKVELSIDSQGHPILAFFNKDDVPDKSILTNGFMELNEHNLIEQSNFMDMNYIFRKVNDCTYILTRDENDIYIEPEIPISNNNEYITVEHIPTTDEIKRAKISYLSSICNKQIIYGIDISINGDIEHFSYTKEDQTNIKELFDLAMQTNMPMYYHSDGNSCKLYTVEQIIDIYTMSAMNKMHHITYFNQLKMYIQSLDDIESVSEIEYGYELSGEYLRTYNSAMEQVTIGMKTLLKVEDNKLEL